MLNFAAVAVHSSAETGAGKNPASGGAVAETVKSDFRHALAAEKGPAVAASAAEAKPAPAAGAMPHFTVLAGKTARPGKKGPANKASARLENAGPEVSPIAAKAPPALPPPAAAATITAQRPASPQPAATPMPGNIAAIFPDHPVMHSHPAAAQAIGQSTRANAAAKPQPGVTGAGQVSAPALAQAGLQNGGIATGAVASHATASPHPLADASHITRQLAAALPAGAAGTSASHALHVSLTPESLGTITVKIEHRATGDAHVTITATQPETLASLKKDAADLDRILTNAGVPEASRQIEFRAAPVAPSQAGAGLGNAAGSPSQNNSGGERSSGHGTGFANSFSGFSTDASPPPAAARRAVSSASAHGGLNMIA